MGKDHPTLAVGSASWTLSLRERITSALPLQHLDQEVAQEGRAHEAADFCSSCCRLDV